MHWVTLVVAILSFLTAVGGFSLLFVKVKEVHVLVNSNLTAVMKRLGIEQDRSTQLTTTLKDAGVEVPAKPDDDKGLDIS
jgi:hypothetical protein